MCSNCRKLVGGSRGTRGAGCGAVSDTSMLEAMNGVHSLRKIEMLKVSEVMHCMQFCMWKVIEGVMCLFAVVAGFEGTSGDAVCASLYAMGCGWFALFAGDFKGVRGAEFSALCTSPYAGGCERCTLFAGGS